MMADPVAAHAQSTQINLSPKHSAKLNKMQSAHKRLGKFYKFYRLDSAKHMRREERRLRKVLDSTFRAENGLTREARKLKRKKLPHDIELRQIDSVDIGIRQWYQILNDSSSSDSLKQVSSQKLRSLVMQKARTNPGMQNLLEEYQLNGDTLSWSALTTQMPELDSMSRLFNSDPESFFKLAEEHATKHLSSMDEFGSLSKELSQAAAISDLPTQLSDKYEKYADPEFLKEEGKRKAVEEAVDYFAEHADKLQSAQANISKLVSKYRSFSNSNDMLRLTKPASRNG